MDAKAPFLKEYHGLMRPEIASLIPRSASNILDLGCGSGRLGHFIKTRQKCTYHGIENNEQAANIAKQFLDRVYAYDLNDHPAVNKGLGYDTLILADILEHLHDPWRALKHFAGELHESGTIVASIPNIAHPTVVEDLTRGLFRYTPAGILDRTHLRFFTLPTICQMFSALGLKITRAVPSPPVDNPVQWLITAKKAPCYNKPIHTTIIIPTHNQLGLLSQTISYIKKNTITGYKIIVINNAPRHDVSDWLESQGDILEIRCTQNLGFTIATNLGMEISRTPHTVLMNNDVIVTKGWLTRMISCMDTDQNIGIVGPITNNVSGRQRHLSAQYDSMNKLSDFASKVTKDCGISPIDCPRIVFFCTLIKKEVIDKIGLLDERFSPGNFEDDDFCLRSLEAGFRNVIDPSTYVHHWGSSSWKENPEAYKETLKRNKTYFFSKWGIKADKFLRLSS